MQLNRTMGTAVHTTAKNSQTLYGVFVSCNRCSGVHEMGISVALEGGPFVKQSLGALYKEKSVPKNLADLANNTVTCPQTGRQFTQKNHQYIFLVPPKS